MHSHLNQINYPFYTTQRNAKAVSARKFVEFEKVTIAEKIHNNRIFDTKKAALKRLSFASYGAEGRTRTGTYFYG